MLNYVGVATFVAVGTDRGKQLGGRKVGELCCRHKPCLARLAIGRELMSDLERC